MATLATMIADLRRRIGEIEPGFWTDLELTDILNYSQDTVAQDLQDSLLPWAKTRKWQTPLLSGADTYVMPSDILAVVAVSYSDEVGSITPVREANVRAVHNDTARYQPAGDKVALFQFDAMDAPFVVEGIAEAGSPTSMTDQDNVDFTTVRPGDIIFNLDDGNASAIITQVDTGRNVINFGEWRGGTRDTFQEGDAYRIQQQERDRDAMFIHPVVNFEDEEIFEGTPSSISVYRSIEVVALFVNFTALDPNWNETTSLRFTVRPVQNLLSILVEGNIHNPRVGLNEAEIPNFVLRPDTEYRLSFEQTVDTLIDRVRLTAPKGTVLDAIQPGASVDDRPQVPLARLINIEYTPYPRPMTDANSICELRRFQLEPCFRKAKRLAMEKKDPLDLGLQRLDLEYEQSLDKCRITMLNQTPAPDTWIEQNEPRSVDHQGFARDFGSGLPWY